LKRETLHKHEILRSRKEIADLFLKGKSFLMHPIKVVYLETDAGDLPCKMLFMVPKKRFRRAHDRNRLRRLMKEAYRRQKQLLGSEGSNTVKTFHVAWVYVGTEPLNYHVLFDKVARVMQRIRELFEPNKPGTESGEKP
jgi:ribonuclease P protein component